MTGAGQALTASHSAASLLMKASAASPVQPCHLVDVRAADECPVAGTAQNDDPARVLA